jgi:hypothetical protein
MSRSSWVVVWCAIAGVGMLVPGAFAPRCGLPAASADAVVAGVPPFAAAIAAEPGPIALPDLRVGEELRYDARVWKGLKLVGLDVGRAVFRVGQDQYRGRAAWRFEGEASGGAFGWEMRSAVESYVGLDGEPLHFSFSQDGSDPSAKRLEFSPGRIEYWKRQHCEDPNCRNPDHFVMKDGKLVHCTDKKNCELPSHRVWVRRYEHKGQGTAYDMLTAVYLARALDVRPGVVRTIRIVESDRIYDVDINALDDEWVRTEAGSFDCICLALDPRFVSGDPPKKKSKLRGLFGLQGTVRIWIDKATHAPVRIRGTIPAGIDLNGEVNLVARNPGR